MYNGCWELRAVPEIIDLSEATNINYMFQNCKALTRVPELKNTRNVENANSLFAYCERLEEVYPILNLPSYLKYPSVPVNSLL